MNKHRIPVIAGDGIGREVMPEGLRVVEVAARRYGIDKRVLRRWKQELAAPPPTFVTVQVTDRDPSPRGTSITGEAAS